VKAFKGQGKNSATATIQPHPPKIENEHNDYKFYHAKNKRIYANDTINLGTNKI
ncbi:9629_t:CDS:1, partial [Racocetra fulgida]